MCIIYRMILNMTLYMFTRFLKAYARIGESTNDAVIIQSDDAPTQYKNKYAFSSMSGLYQILFGVRIVSLVTVQLVDAMSSFGVKAILRRDIISKDDWFSTSQEIVDHLQFRGKPDMYYKTIHPEPLGETRQNAEEMKIDQCMNMYLFVFKPKETKVYMKEYLCDCTSCLEFNFDACEKTESDAGVVEGKGRKKSTTATK